MTTETSHPRFAELVGALTLATDLAAGLAPETALRVCMLAVEIGKGLGLRREALVDLHDTALLRFIGCTSYAHETARVGGGDDLGLLRDLTLIDGARIPAAIKHVITHAGRGRAAFACVVLALVALAAAFSRRRATLSARARAR